MDLIQLITGQSPAMALVILMFYFYQKQSVENVRREREIAEAAAKREREYGEITAKREQQINEIMRAERREFLDALRELRQQTAEMLNRSTEAITNCSNQMHALRGSVTQGFLSLGVRQKREERDHREGGQ